MTSEDLTKWVNDKFGLSEEEGYREQTVRNWLHELNFSFTEDKKVNSEPSLSFEVHESTTQHFDTNTFADFVLRRTQSPRCHCL